jgi:hypothetical protein
VKIIRSVSIAEVAWCFLSHELKWRGLHSHLRDVFGLDLKTFPETLWKTPRAERNIAVMFQGGNQIWELRELDFKDIGKTQTRVHRPPYDGSCAAVEASLAYQLHHWKSYLRGHHPNAYRDREDHQKILETLHREGTVSLAPIMLDLRNWKICDGAHRCLAVYDFMLQKLDPSTVILANCAIR